MSKNISLTIEMGVKQLKKFAARELWPNGEIYDGVFPRKVCDMVSRFDFIKSSEEKGKILEFDIQNLLSALKDGLKVFPVAKNYEIVFELKGSNQKGEGARRYAVRCVATSLGQYCGWNITRRNSFRKDILTFVPSKYLLAGGCGYRKLRDREVETRTRLYPELTSRVPGSLGVKQFKKNKKKRRRDVVGDGTDGEGNLRKKRKIDLSPIQGLEGKEVSVNFCGDGTGDDPFII